MKKTKTDYIGIITIYKNIPIEAETDQEAWNILNDHIQREKEAVEDCYEIDANNAHLTK